MYDGHQFVKIDNTWVFDLTEYKGYKVKANNGKIESYTKAFSAIEIDNNMYYFEKYIEVSLSILKKALKIINKNNEDTLICKAV